MQRKPEAGLPAGQDHPDDRAWLKLTFDFVAPSGELGYGQVVELLQYFYRQRSEGATLSGT
jgi:hypothetical protein